MAIRGAYELSELNCVLLPTGVGVIIEPSKRRERYIKFRRTKLIAIFWRTLGILFILLNNIVGVQRQ